MPLSFIFSVRDYRLNCQFPVRLMMSNALKEPPVGFLAYDLDYMPNHLKARARKELLDDDDTRERSLESLRSMLREEKDLLWQDDDVFLLAFLRVRKFDIQKTCHLVKHMYATLGKYRSVFYNFRFDDFKKVLEEGSSCFLPFRDSEGSILVLFRVATWNTEVNSMTEHILLLSSGVFCAIRSPATHVGGVKLIIDFKGMTLKHLLQCSPSNLRLAIEMLQDFFPIRVRGVYLVNQARFFKYIWMVIEPLLSKKIRERLHLHGDDLESLHECIPPSILPEELGGELPPASSAELGKMVMNSEEYVNRVFSFGYQKYLKKSRCEKEKVQSQRNQSNQ